MLEFIKYIVIIIVGMITVMAGILSIIYFESKRFRIAAVILLVILILSILIYDGYCKIYFFNCLTQR